MSGWNRRNPVLNQEVLKKVLNESPELLLGRLWDELLKYYNEAAKQAGLLSATKAALTQVLRHRFEEWDTKLKKGEKL